MSTPRPFWALLALVLLVGACTDGDGSDTTDAGGASPAATSAAPVPSPPRSESTTTSEAGAEYQPTESLPGVDRILSGSVSFPDGVEIPPGEVWAFDPAVPTVVESGANVVVLGTLVMRPGDPAIEHVLRFVGVDEDAFVGGGMDPVATDVGLWVVGDGALDLEGASKTAWGYEWLDDWAGDEVVAAPTAPGDYTTFAQVAGPGDVPPVNEYGYHAELLNLTRNVRIEGTPEGKTHVFVRSSRPQSIRYVAIRYVAPAFGELRGGSRVQGAEERPVGADITGRYGIHFHHNGEASRGSIVEGVVIRDADNHAFVPHASHGITFRDTISYNTANAAYWWDPRSREGPSNASNDTVYERAVAALVYPGDGRDSAFNLADGENNSVIDSVAVGVQGRGPSNSGFRWPGTEKAIWIFHDNIAHNNAGHGIFVWQNTTGSHVIERFSAYLNGRPGIAHGAYSNSYVYRDIVLRGNDQRSGSDIAVQSHAVGRPSGDGGTDLQLWENVDTGGSIVLLTKHALDPMAPVRFQDCDFSGVVVDEGERNYSIWEFVDCGIQPEDVTIRYMNPRSILRSQDGAAAWELTVEGGVREIAPFAG